jgi:hypothetical protein
MEEKYKAKTKGGYEEGEKEKIYQSLSVEQLKRLIDWKKRRIGMLKRRKKRKFPEVVEGLNNDLRKIKEILKDREVEE